MSKPVGAQSFDSNFYSKACREHIGAELRDLAISFKRARCMELGDRHVEGDCLPICSADDGTHAVDAPPPFLAGAIEMPTPTHQHMRHQDEIPGEIDE
jgi:hypothetical protein